MNPGDVCYVQYGEAVVHERLLGCHIHNSTWAIVTPDWDVYDEQMEAGNPDLTFFAYGGGLGRTPSPGVNPPDVYGFGPLSAQEYQRLLAQARVYAAGARALLGIPAAGVPVAPAAPPVAAGANPQDPEVWVSMENRGNYFSGQVVVQAGSPLPVGHAVLGGDRALIPIDGGLTLAIKKIKTSELASFKSKDLRTLPIKFDSQGARRRDFFEAVALMSADELPGGKLQLEGPSTAIQVLRSLTSRGLTPITDHERWVRSSEIAKQDRSLYEMEVLARVLEAMVMVDQLNVPNLKSGELILRRWQLIKEAHRLSPAAPDYSSSDFFMSPN
eukprot:Skav229290  [mRNA]  locus=scaffold544:87897:88883:+ [translate_table: standard]